MLRRPPPSAQGNQSANADVATRCAANRPRGGLAASSRSQPRYTKGTANPWSCLSPGWQACAVQKGGEHFDLEVNMLRTLPCGRRSFSKPFRPYTAHGKVTTRSCVAICRDALLTHMLQRRIRGWARPIFYVWMKIVYYERQWPGSTELCGPEPPVVWD